MVGEEKFRKVMGHFATGVTVVTARSPGGDPTGLTVNAFTSVSLDPPLVLVCIHRDADSHDPLIASGAFAVNILGEDQGPLALTFAEAKPDQRFRALPATEGITGSPLLTQAPAWLECTVRDVLPGGDHSIILGEVVTCGARDASPLLFHRGELKGLSG